MKKLEFKYDSKLKLIGHDNEEFDANTGTFDRKVTLFSPNGNRLMAFQDHQHRTKDGKTCLKGTTRSVKCFDDYFVIEQHHIDHALSSSKYISAVYDYTGKILAVYSSTWQDAAKHNAEADFANSL